VLLGLVKVPSDWVNPLEQISQYSQLEGPEREFIRIKHFTKPFREALTYFTAGRKFYIDSHGRLGLGPRDVKKGDEIVILFGGHVPYHLRKEDSQHRLIGELFVDGLMTGESLQVVGETTFMII
jgi:hypothetical protein